MFGPSVNKLYIEILDESILNGVKFTFVHKYVNMIRKETVTKLIVVNTVGHLNHRNIFSRKLFKSLQVFNDFK